MAAVVGSSAMKEVRPSVGEPGAAPGAGPVDVMRDTHDCPGKSVSRTRVSTSVETSVVSARVDALLWPEVFLILKARIAKYGGEIEFKNLAPLYENVYPRTDLRRLLYTGLSDGKKIALHQDRAKIGSPVRWTWDALHLFGHMFQWHINRAQASSRSLKYWGTDAQAMATRNFLGSSIDDLRRMQNYELEANRFSLSLFLDCLKEKRGSVMTNHLQELMDEFCC